MMDLAEIEKLLPLYVAGTLSPEEVSAVEGAIRDHPELASHVSFWRMAGQVTRDVVRRGELAHPASELIVDYAEGRLGDAKSREHVRQHLLECAGCRAESEMVRQTLVATSRWPTAIGQISARALRFVTGIKQFVQFPVRLVGAIPAVAVALVVLFMAAIYVIHTPPEPTGLRLAYELRSRATAPAVVPLLKLNEGEKAVSVRVEVPRASIAKTGYVITVSDPAERSLAFDGAYTVRNQDKRLDLIDFNLSVEGFLPTDGLYTISIQEKLPPDSRLTSEEYLYNFRVAGRSGDAVTPHR